MAQRAARQGTKGLRALASRMGLRAHAGVVGSALMLVVGLGGFGLLHTLSPGVEIARGDDSSTVAAASAATVGEDGDGPSKGVGTDESAVPTGTAQGEPAELVVHVDGAVREPGVYRLRLDDARVADAVESAGGLADDADTSTLNLASPLADGTKIHVPYEGEEAPAQQQAGEGFTAVEPDQGVGPQLINLNSASSEELQTLSGVGEATARAIIEDREAHGPFSSVDDLLRVSGIGEKKLARIRDHVCV